MLDELCESKNRDVSMLAMDVMQLYHSMVYSDEEDLSSLIEARE